MSGISGDLVTLVSLAVAGGGVLFLLLAWRRNRPAASAGERIELVTSRYLGGRKVLTLVDVEGERLLLALSGDSVRLVARLAPRGRDRTRRSPALEKAAGQTATDAVAVTGARPLEEGVP